MSVEFNQKKKKRDFPSLDHGGTTIKSLPLLSYYYRSFPGTQVPLCPVNFVVEFSAICYASYEIQREYPPLYCCHPYSLKVSIYLSEG